MTCREYLAYLAGEFERAVGAFEARGKGGQQVPYRGPFAAGPPSTIIALRHLARDIREFLTATQGESP